MPDQSKEMYKRNEDAAAILEALRSKFSENLDLALRDEQARWSLAELKARAIPAVAHILAEENCLSLTQKAMLCVFDEIFADVVISCYLSGCGLDRPAQMMLRRALELGVASVYLWDLPHVFWGWKNHDKDLNFNEMIEHLGGAGYRDLIKTENPARRSEELIDASSAKAIYRSLSNVIHGKITTFESLLPDRFEHVGDDWRQHLLFVLKVEDLLIQLWTGRFRAVGERLVASLPQLEIIDGLHK